MIKARKPVTRIPKKVGEHDDVCRFDVKRRRREKNRKGVEKVELDIRYGRREG